jgi:hypothetical protein
MTYSREYRRLARPGWAARTCMVSRKCLCEWYSLNHTNTLRWLASTRQPTIASQKPEAIVSITLRVDHYYHHSTKQFILLGLLHCNYIG